MKMLRAVGLMSGTSLDGVDAALIETDGERVFATGRSLTLEYDAALRRDLRGLLDRAGTLSADDIEVALLSARLTARHAEAVAALGVPADIVGFHGQTILHRPAERRTWQIGDAAALAGATGLPVAHDFRSADVAAGGEGAPLAPVFHAALAADLPRPLAVLNLGGVGNATWIGNTGISNTGISNTGIGNTGIGNTGIGNTGIGKTGIGNTGIGKTGIGNTGIGKTGIGNAGIGNAGIGADGALLACDTGPGNGPLDDWAAARGFGPIDRDGALSRSGAVDESVLARLLSDPYFARPAPKSLDRLDFARALASSGLSSLSAADGAATLAAFTARAVALAKWPAPPLRWLVTGGGRRNPSIMRALRGCLGVPVDAVEGVGWDGDALEAQCFGFLAVRVLRGLPLSFPGTTGAPTPLAGGRIAHP